MILEILDDLEATFTVENACIYAIVVTIFKPTILKMIFQYNIQHLSQANLSFNYK